MFPTRAVVTPADGAFCFAGEPACWPPPLSPVPRESPLPAVRPQGVVCCCGFSAPESPCAGPPPCSTPRPTSGALASLCLRSFVFPEHPLVGLTRPVAVSDVPPLSVTSTEHSGSVLGAWVSWELPTAPPRGHRSCGACRLLMAAPGLACTGLCLSHESPVSQDWCSASELLSGSGVSFRGRCVSACWRAHAEDRP